MNQSTQINNNNSIQKTFNDIKINISIHNEDQMKKTPIPIVEEVNTKSKKDIKNIFFETESNENDQDWEEDTFFCKSRKNKRFSNRFKNTNYISPKYQNTHKDIKQNGITFSLKSKNVIQNATNQLDSVPRKTEDSKRKIQSNSSSKKYVFKKFNSFSKSMSNDAKSITEKKFCAMDNQIKIFKAEISSNRTHEKSSNNLQNILNTINIPSKSENAKKEETQVVYTPTKVNKRRGVKSKHLSSHKKPKIKYYSNSRKDIYTPKTEKSKLNNLSRKRNYKSLTKISKFPRKMNWPLKTYLNRRKGGKKHNQTLNYSVYNKDHNPSIKFLKNSNYLSRPNHNSDSITSMIPNPKNLNLTNKMSKIKKKYKSNEYAINKNVLFEKKKKSNSYQKNSIESSKKGASSNHKKRELNHSEVSKDPKQKNILSVYSRISHPVYKSKGNSNIRQNSEYNTMTNNNVFSSNTFESWMSSKKTNMIFSTGHKFKKLRKMVSNNLKSIEKFYVKKNGSKKVKNFSKGGLNCFKHKKKKSNKLHNNANKENMYTNYKYNSSKKYLKPNISNTAKTKGNSQNSISKILNKFRNKSLKPLKKYNYKTKILSRDKYINQRVNQMIKLNHR